VISILIVIFLFTKVFAHPKVFHTLFLTHYCAT
jgi:hypothetical protein